ncbi:hypothetical protein B0H10DRAFT_1937947 [Mycena sp. CBHHK59/15]|nr:hypothetical protein B0H10DRAFT_1937947 [Mycena sp. CBHHK59/15]
MGGRSCQEDHRSDEPRCRIELDGGGCSDAGEAAKLKVLETRGQAGGRLEGGKGGGEACCYFEKSDRRKGGYKLVHDVDSTDLGCTTARPAVSEIILRPVCLRVRLSMLSANHRLHSVSGSIVGQEGGKAARACSSSIGLSVNIMRQKSTAKEETLHMGRPGFTDQTAGS